MAAQLGFKVTQVKIRKMVLFKAKQSDAIRCNRENDYEETDFKR